MNKNYSAALVLGLASMVNLGMGFYRIADVHSRRENIRREIYARAEEVTPRVRELANRAARQEGDLELQLSSFNFIMGVASGYAGAVALKETKRKE
jgi:hypothetical protein